jgi:hypothetical protein
MKVSVFRFQDLAPQLPDTRNLIRLRRKTYNISKQFCFVPLWPFFGFFRFFRVRTLWRSKVVAFCSDFELHDLLKILPVMPTGKLIRSTDSDVLGWVEQAAGSRGITIKKFNAALKKIYSIS